MAVRLSFRCVLVLALLGLALPAGTAAAEAIDESERNRKLLEQWRSDPEHLRRLMVELQAFQSLPKSRQEQLRHIDRALRQADPATQQRLWGVLERYAAWLDALPETDRRRIDAAPNRNERLKLIKELCDAQWVDRLPQPDREAVRKLPAEKRGIEIARLRREDRQRRLAWQKALQTRPPAARSDSRPRKLTDFPTETQTFVADHLVPMLSEAEKQQVQKAEGRWPALALTLLELSERHPVLPPPHGRAAVTRYPDLPHQLKMLLPHKRLVNQGQWSGLQRTRDKWPDFALAFTELARRDGKPLPVQLGACRPREFSPSVQQFLATKLEPALSSADAARLKEAEGKWPEYPRLLHELSQAHQLAIPGMSLPGPRAIWELARLALPEVPDRILQEFAVTELSEEERSRLNLSIADPASRDRIKQEFFRKHPNELRRYRRLAVERTEK